jgi:hypothetical protein
VAALPAICVAMLILSFFGYRDVDASEGYLQRARILAELQADGNRHLIVVRFGPKPLQYGAPNPDFDGWVFNGADIDASPVVWAREMDTEHNLRLLKYFKDRRVWLLDLEWQPPALVPYPCINETEQATASR